MTASRKIIEQKQEVEVKMAQMVKIWKKNDSSLLDQHKHDYYNTDES